MTALIEQKKTQEDETVDKLRRSMLISLNIELIFISKNFFHLSVRTLKVNISSTERTFSRLKVHI